MMTESLRTHKLDKEWVELILSAKAIGLTVSEIRAFLKSEVTEKDKQLHNFKTQQAKSEK
jgi:DNA-binding transcriptional MerR regulator